MNEQEQYSFLDDDYFITEKDEPPSTDTCSKSLEIPTWIDWNCTDYPLGNPTPDTRSYRKITNVWGGDKPDGDLKWLSEFDTVAHPKKTAFKSAIYDINPKYLWGLDAVNKKLKVAYNSYGNDDIKDPVNLDPFVTCEKNNICCSKSSNTENCFYKWDGKSTIQEKCGTDDNAKHNKFSLTDGSKRKEEWTYFNDKLGEDADIYNGTFCNHIPHRGSSASYGAHMKKYIGCDCQDHKNNNYECQNVDRFQGCSSKSGNIYNNNIYGNEWKFIDEAAAVACCNLDADKAGLCPQCNAGFDIHGDNKNNNKCPQLMEEFCRDHWSGDYNTINKLSSNNAKREEVKSNICKKWLSELTPGSVAQKSIQLLIQGYITNNDKNIADGPRSPQDYISPALYKFDKAAEQTAKENGITLKYKSPSIAYYDDENCDENCNAGKNPNNLSSCDTATGKKCNRDDSKEGGFFDTSLPNLCKSKAGDGGDTCKPQLQYFCAQFTRDQLMADEVLLGVCGCYAISSSNDGQSGNNIVGMHRPMELLNKNSPDTLPKNDSVYYKGLDETICDPICIGSKIGNTKCTNPPCVMDNVSINLHNSESKGGTSIFQDCKGGNCYIKDTSITADKSSIGGRIEIKQDCKACYTFTDNINTATQVKCGTLTDTGLGETPAEEIVKNILKNKSNNTTTIIIFVVVILIIIVILGFLFYKYK